MLVCAGWSVAFSADPPPLSGVYMIYNCYTDDFYVGSSVNLCKRKRLHAHHLRQRRHHCRHLQSAWNKYGEDAFTFVIVQLVMDKEMRLRVEQALLDLRLYGDKLYNAAPQARSCEGIVRNAATRARLRASFTPERRALLAAVGRRPKSEEHKARIAAAHIGMRASAETRRKLRAAWVRRRAKGRA